MLFLLRHSKQAEYRRAGSATGSGMLSLGMLSLLFGILVFLAPELLAYLVASFFVIIGASMVAMWLALHRSDLP
jgi:uncharacterized membrane protein HdeD (DUF308 family)